MATTGITNRVHIRPGALGELASILNRLETRRVFVVADRDAYEFSGAREVVDRDLKHFDLTFFKDFQPNPKIEDAQAGIDLFNATDAGTILAIGGGTAIDLAKLIAAFAGRPQQSLNVDTIQKPVTHQAAPLIAVPTTAGTGSEATHFAVVYVDGVKHSVAGDVMLPGYVLVDSLLTHSLPPGITAATGLDAFCQAIESIWAVGATGESIGYAETAARLALDNLPAAVNSPTREARRRMCRAAHLAGKAINISKTTLPHAMSYAITSDYGLPHGQAVAITLAASLEFNAGVTEQDCLDPRGAAAVQARIQKVCNVLKATDIQQACDKISGLIAAVGCPRNSREAGIATQAEHAAIAAQVNEHRLSNNPRRTTAEDRARLLACHD